MAFISVLTLAAACSSGPEEEDSTAQEDGTSSAGGGPGAGGRSSIAGRPGTAGKSGMGGGPGAGGKEVAGPGPVPVGGPCDKAKKAIADGAGKPPSVYGSAWTPAPTEPCTFTDGEGRTVNMNAMQHRMIYRVNEVRALQSAADGRKRVALETDYCLQEFSQAYAESDPGGHSEMNLSFYPIPGGGQGTGGNFIGENYGAHGGYTSDPLAAVDRLVAGWWSSGSTDTGHRGNMLDPEWSKGGMGVVVSGSSALGLQTFSRKYANWLSGWEPCTKPPKTNDPMSTIPKPLKR